MASGRESLTPRIPFGLDTTRGLLYKAHKNRAIGFRGVQQERLEEEIWFKKI